MTTTVRRTELSDFLKARRAAVSPADAGLPAGPRRRTPGLRREEVAVLAGVGVSWYQWLEQGRDITVSAQVVDAVSRVLRLSDAERRRLYVLAGLNPPLPTEHSGGVIGADLLRLIDAWMPRPAHLLDRYWNLIAANDAAQVVLGYGPAEHSNCMVEFFTNPIHNHRYQDWDDIARRVVAQYRDEMTAHPDDLGYAEVVDELLARSTAFAELWARHEASPGGVMIKHIDHPTVGELVLESSQLRLADRPDLLIVLHNTVADTGTEEKVARLLADYRSPGLRLVSGS